MTAPVIRGVNHIGITVPDIEAAKSFLMEAFGGQLIYYFFGPQDPPRQGPEFERVNPRSYDLTREGFARTGAGILRCFAAIMTSATAPTTLPVHQQLANRFAPRPEYADIICRALVLFADHGLAPATYAVRAAANTGATPYQLVLIGLDTMR